ncbi:response regulator [Pseudomonas chlororaphis]|uniref:response regulator n=1 Tax=Pseudomonas chlororaphis TaxID=587753 RepID=UPI000F56ADBF|nr:response regulator [Pseudomonas chlororaphis]
MADESMTSLRILVLEKYSAQRSTVVAALQQLGVFDILQASSGEQALALMQRQGQVDVALCDLAHMGMELPGFSQLRGPAFDGPGGDSLL